MRESQIENAVTKYAKSHGWLGFKFTSPSNRSVPDRIYLKDGVTVFIEFKAPGKKPTKLQAHTHRKFKRHGFDVYVVDDIEQGKDILNANS